MNALITTALGSISIMMALSYINAPASEFFDVSASFIVFGGTIAIAFTSLPWSFGREIFKYYTDTFYLFFQNNQKITSFCLAEIQKKDLMSEKNNIKGFAGEIYNQGKELTLLDFEADKVSTILNQRLESRTSRQLQFGYALKNLAKYPPAFGLAGTVLGLVGLMNGISNGETLDNFGLQMAVALLATLYGIIFSNLIILPLAENCISCAGRLHIQAKLMMRTIEIMQSDTNILEAQETLNSVLPNHERIDLFPNNLGKINDIK